MTSVAHNYDFDKNSGFIMDPNEHKRVGYITKLTGFNNKTPIAADLTVSVPFQGAAKYTGIKLTPPSAVPTVGIQLNGSLSQITQVVGVIEKFEYDGSVGGALKFDFWVSQENSTTIKAMQQTTLLTTKVDELGWWFCDYDQETKIWFEQGYPCSMQEIKGLITGKENPALDVDLTPVPVKDGIDVFVYKIHMEVVPAANMAYALMFANSSNKPVAKAWGLQIGNLSKDAFT